MSNLTRAISDVTVGTAIVLIHVALKARADAEAARKRADTREPPPPPKLRE